MSRKPIVRLTDSFKVFADKFNILTNNVGDPLFLTTHNDSDVVTTINEINATFQAYDGKIVYPNDSVPTGAAYSGYDAEGNSIDYPSYTGAQLPSTHLVITTNQHGGQDIDIDAGRDFLVDAVRHINLTGVNFDGDYSGTYINKVDGTSLDSVGGTITVIGNSTYTLTTGSNYIQNTTGNVDISASGNFIFDALGDITLDADGNDIIFKNGQGGDTVTHSLADDGEYTVSSPFHYTVDAEGDIILDADGNDIILKNGAGNDQVTHNLNNNGNYSINAPSAMYLNTVGDIVLNADGNDFIFRNNEGGAEDSARFTLDNAGNFDISTLADFTLDVAGDIVLDADGNDIIFKNGDGNDQVTHTLADTGAFTVAAPNNYTIDASGDINLDAAGDNITLKDGGTTRQQYSLGATTTIATTGNRTETVTGNVSDSAAGTYHIGATGNMDIDTRGTLDIVSGGNATLDTTGDVLVKASGDITLDAETDIILDAGDSDIIFKRNGTQFVKTQMGMAGDATLVRQLYSQGGLELDVAGNFSVDASGDIILDAAADDVILKDAGTEFLRFTHAGGGNGRIDNNGIPVITFEDSDAVFNSDVNIEDNLDVDGTLNVDGATTLNGSVDLGNAAADDISINGKVDTNILPKTTNANNLGSSTLQWRHAWFDGTVFADNLDGDSGTIANFNFNSNTMSGTSGINLDAAGDITLNAKGDDIIFEGTFNGVDSSRVHFDLGNNQSSVVQRVVNRNLVLEVDKNIYLDANEGFINLRDSANQTRVQFDYNHALSAGAEMNVYGGSLTMDVSGDIVLDADGGDVVLKDGGTQFGRFENVSDNLKVYSGAVEAMTFDGANVTTSGTITPGTTLNTVGTDLVTAINEVHDDVGTISSLSTFYNSHNTDVVTALNRVAARIIDVYDENGTLLNN